MIINKKIIFFDIDDTILVSSTKIYLKNKSGEIIRDFTTKEFDNFSFQKNQKDFYFDFSEFNNKNKTISDLHFANPIWKNIKIIKKFLKKGWQLGFITARGCEQAVFDGLLLFFQKNKISVPLQRELVFAVNDNNSIFSFKEEKTENKKLEILKFFLNKECKIYFLDNNPKNILTIKNFYFENKVFEKKLFFQKA